jgi:hypothetical protein
MERLNPLNDYIFKRLMGEEESKDNLIAFLNAVLNSDDQKKLVSLELLDNDTELVKEMISDKTGRLDVRAGTADGMQIDIEVHFIELPKFRRFDQKDLRRNPLHRWLRFLDKMLTEEELKELIEMDSAIKRAEKKLEYLSSDEETMALYRAREDSLHERANMIYSAKMEGKIEGKIEDAKNMLLKNLSLDLIAEIASLSMEEIKALQTKNNDKSH